MSSHLIQQSKVVQAQLRTDIPEFTVGSVLSVHYKIKEGAKERIQIFSGIVIDRHQKTSINASFKVLKVSTAGIKTMRTFPIHSPNIDKIVVTKLQRGRRATLNYLIKMKDPIKAIRAKKVQPRIQPETELKTNSEIV